VCFFCGAVDGLANAKVGGTAAEVSHHGFVDVVIVGMSPLGKQGCGRHDLTGLAVTALRDLLTNPSLLHGVQTVHGEPLNGDNPLSSSSSNRCLAGTRCDPVEMDGACSAEPDATAVFCPSHAKQIAEYPQQWHRGIGIYAVLAAVDLKRESVHAQLLKQGSTVETTFASQMQGTELNIQLMLATLQPIGSDR
jgi:hypothetical protein